MTGIIHLPVDIGLPFAGDSLPRHCRAVARRHLRHPGNFSVREYNLRRGDGYVLEGLIGKLVGLVGMSERVREPGSSLACCATPCGTA